MTDLYLARKQARVAVVLSVAMAAVPLIAYLGARATGGLPSQLIWDRLEINHGPWHESWWGWSVGLGFLLSGGLALGGAVSGVALALSSRKQIAILWGLATSLTGLVLLFCYGKIFWVID